MRKNFSKVEPAVGTPEVVDCRQSDMIELQVAGLSGGDTITVDRSLDKENYVTATVLDQLYDPATNPVASDGLYFIAAGCHLRFTKTGSASSPSVTVRQNQED